MSPSPAGIIAREQDAGPKYIASDLRTGIWSNENVLSSLSGASLAIFTRPKEENGLGWTREEVEVLLAGVRRDMRNTNIHAYWRV